METPTPIINAQGWHTEPPPQDQPIVAIAHIVWTEDACTTSSRLVAEIQWTENPGESSGWHYPNGLAVQTCLEDEVIINFWMPMPEVQS